MNILRSPLTLVCWALLTGSLAWAQPGGSRTPQRTGITDIMRGPTSIAVPPATAQPASSTAQRAAEYIVALVNSEPLTNTEVQKRVERVLSDAGAEAQRMPREQLHRLALEQLIAERSQLQLAKEMGIRADEAMVNHGVEMVARQNTISVTELLRRVQQSGLSVEDFRTNVRNQLLLTRLRERELESKIKVSDAEIDQYLSEQAGGAAAHPSLNIAQVLVAVPENANPAEVTELQRRAQDVVRRARSGEDFAKLAAELSAAPEGKTHGGEMGLRNVERYPALFVEATQSTSVGDVTGPVRSGAGFHVLKVLARDSGGSAPGQTITQTQVRHILIRPDARRSVEQAVAQLKDMKARVQGGKADFATLAREQSSDTGSARNGGELGWTVPGSFVAEFEAAMGNLQPNQISEPVVTRFGVHLIQVQARRELKISPAELREAARNQLREQKAEEAYQGWAQEVRNRAFVELREPPRS